MAPDLSDYETKLSSDLYNFGDEYVPYDSIFSSENGESKICIFKIKKISNSIVSVLSQSFGIQLILKKNFNISNYSVFFPTGDEFLEHLLSPSENEIQTPSYDNAVYFDFKESLYQDKLEPNQHFTDMDMLLM